MIQFTLNTTQYKTVTVLTHSTWTHVLRDPFSDGNDGKRVSRRTLLDGNTDGEVRSERAESDSLLLLYTPLLCRLELVGCPVPPVTIYILSFVLGPYSPIGHHPHGFSNLLLIPITLFEATDINTWFMTLMGNHAYFT